MKIRREDEEFIESLKLFGACAGAVLAVVLVVGVRNQAVSRLDEQREHVRRNVSLLVLADMDMTSDGAGKPTATVGEFVNSVDQAKSDLEQMKKGFWTTLPLGGLVGVCAVAGGGGFIGGYCSMWLLSWIGTLATIKFIRSTYRVIWRINPDFDGGLQLEGEDDGALVQRDERRIMPGIVKLFVMGLVALGVLAIVVYRLVR